MLEEGQEVEMHMPNGDVHKGIVNTVSVVGDTIRYLIESLTNGILYIVYETKVRIH